MLSASTIGVFERISHCDEYRLCYYTGMVRCIIVLLRPVGVTALLLVLPKTCVAALVRSDDCLPSSLSLIVPVIGYDMALADDLDLPRLFLL